MKIRNRPKIRIGKRRAVMKSISTQTLEELRRSMLDDHWAVPSKGRSAARQFNSDKNDGAKPNVIPGEEGSLFKQSRHNSGTIPSKKVYSDADIVFSTDWVPPITIVLVSTHVTTLDVDPVNGRKKTSSVSYSSGSNIKDAEKHSEHKEKDKQETRKKVNFGMK